MATYRHLLQYQEYKMPHNMELMVLKPSACTEQNQEVDYIGMGEITGQSLCILLIVNKILQQKNSVYYSDVWLIRSISDVWLIRSISDVWLIRSIIAMSG